MLLRINHFLLLGLAAINVFSLVPVDQTKGWVLGATTVKKQETINNQVHIATVSSFDQTEVIEYEDIFYEITYVEDDEKEYGIEEVLEPGVNGVKTLTYLATHWQGEELYKNLVSTVVEEPQPEVVSKGIKIVWRTINSEYGDLSYWHKMRVWATKYDGNCVGCRGLTYSGTKVVKGVCAVDPKVIPLGTNFYVEGYGMCRSEDIGGAIKGNKIDLGYEDVTKGDWRTGYTNIYILTNPPY